MCRYVLIGFAYLIGFSQIEAADESLLALRREYNWVSAGIDSLVRGMHRIDEDVLRAPTLPEGRVDRIVPDGMTLVMIFWADDEARIWLNGFVVGETRLTPVEVVIPDLYLKGQNQIRARCWDTDWVESGFLCGLYLRDTSGALHPVVVSNDQWTSSGAPAPVITYAHASPDIPGAQPIWGERVFGVVELAITFDQSAVRKAVEKAAQGPGPRVSEKREMDYHDFVKQLSLLQARRENVARDLTGADASPLGIPSYKGIGGRTAALTLGKAAPLEEAMSEPISEKVRAWSQDLPTEQQTLIYPDKRSLKGEEAANLTDGGTAPSGGKAGERQRNFKGPAERTVSHGGDSGGGKAGQSGTSSMEGDGGQGAGGGGLFGRSSRLGLLLPTLILGAYILYVVLNWDLIAKRSLST
jgi:hypothetical protein